MIPRFNMKTSQRLKMKTADVDAINILDRIADGFMAFDERWCVTYMNRRAEQLLPRLEKETGDLLGKNIWEALPDLMDSQAYHEYQRAVTEQVPVAFEMFYEPLKAWFDIRAYPSADGLTVFFREISERKRAEESLRRSEQELTDFFENAPVGLHWVGADGTILRVNQAELDLTGYTHDEYIGRHIAEFHDDREAIEDILQRLTTRHACVVRTALSSMSSSVQTCASKMESSRTPDASRATSRSAGVRRTRFGSAPVSP
jgi:PAS domain-containing protein